MVNMIIRKGLDDQSYLDRVLVLSSVHDQCLTAILKNMLAAKTGVMASTSTVKRQLTDAGLNGKIARRKP